MRFKNKVAFVAGCSSGTCREVAICFVPEGCKFVINSRNKERFEDTAKAIDENGDCVAILVGDIAIPATGQALVQIALDRFGQLDVLFSNAGIFTPKPFVEVDEAEYDRFIDGILKGSFFADQEVAKALIAAGRGGSIVHTESMWVLQAIGAIPSAPYSAAKAGVHSLVKNPAIELAPHQIQVNGIAPAVMETPVFDTFLTLEQVKEVLPTFKGLHPLGRNGQVADVAEVHLLLSSEQASFITGIVLPVYDGVMARRHSLPP